MKYEKFAYYYDKIFPFIQQQADFICEYTQSSDRILELGCGTGQLANYLSDKCQVITAIDNDQTMIKTAIENYPEIDFRVLDINHLEDITSKYDLIFSLGNTLSYLTINELSSLCNKIFNILKTGGRWLYQVVNWDCYSRFTTYNFPDTVTNGLTFSRDYLFRQDNMVDFHLKLINDTDVIFDETHIMYKLSCAEHIELNTNTGFIHTGCYLNWSKQPWAPDKAGGIILTFEKNDKTL